MDKILQPELQRRWLPNPGPQTIAYYSLADVLLYGGAAGGGKTDLLCGLALNEHQNSVIYRRSFVDLASFERRLLGIYGHRNGYNGQDMALRIPGDGVIEMQALDKPGAEFSAQGRPRDGIFFDEGAQLAEDKVLFVTGWLRSVNPRQRKRIVIASNPPMSGEGAWLMTWFAPWLDPLHPNPAANGELRYAVRDPEGHLVWVEGPGYYVLEGEGEDALCRPATPLEAAAADAEEADSVAIGALSYTFVPAMLDDNPYLRGTGYRKQLQSLPEPMRSQLLKGDFLAGRKDGAWQVIPSEWVRLAQERWKPDQGRKGGMLALGVDIAQGGSDQTCLAALYTDNWFAEIDTYKGVDTKDGASVAALVVKKVRDRANISLDLTGGWGGSARDILKNLDIETCGVVFSSGSSARSRDMKFDMLNMRSELWWKFREALDPESDARIALPPDRILAAQLCAPVWRLRGTSIVIEQKDEIRKRLGTSTDKADAVLLAWHRRLRLWEEPVRRPGQHGRSRYQLDEPRSDVA